MASFPVGSVVLGGVTFSTDPEPYEPFNWPRRHSVHPAIGGLVTIQDFGLQKRDNTLRLGSGGSRFMTSTVLQSLISYYQARGTTYTLTDWMNNEFNVFIKDFRWVPFRTVDASTTLYTYNMELHCLSVAKIEGVSYTGS